MSGAAGHDLDRFVLAQDRVYQAVLCELRAGRKRSHWMWFVFPQLASLGQSSTSRHFGIKDAEEARAYHRHPLLGPRLVDCTSLVLAVQGKSARAIFGYPDDLKLCSCMTLFQAAAPDEPVFGQVLERYYAGQGDVATIRLLGDQDS